MLCLFICNLFLLVKLSLELGNELVKFGNAGVRGLQLCLQTDQLVLLFAHPFPILLFKLVEGVVASPKGLFMLVNVFLHVLHSAVELAHVPLNVV